MRFRILGPLEVLSSDNEWTAISAAKWRSLLACLLLRAGQLVPTDSLILELWGDSPPGTANNLVSIYVHRLKKVIGDADGKILVYRAPGYMLRVAPGDVDIEHFESLAAEGADLLAVGQKERAAETLGEALGLWRGSLLADVPQTSLVAGRADQAAELWLTTTELRVEADLACGRAVQVIPELRGLVREYPLRERLWASLIRALEEAGRRAEALERYAQARQVIADELGVDPGAELQRLYAELLAADASAPSATPLRPRPPRGAPGIPDTAAATAATMAPTVARAADAAPPTADDIAGGADQEPDTEPPGSIAIGTFAQPAPAVDTAVAGLAVPGGILGPPSGLLRPAQLPADIGDFTGREAHAAHLRTLLLEVNATSSSGAVRIAVVNGAGGLGKTTLAVHAAHQVSAEFPDGQLYVDLLGASPQAATPGEVLARFLRDLGIEGDKIPARDDERATLFRSALTGRRVLILLDNAKDAAQVRPLLPGSSSCAVLVTTRNRTSDLASTRFVDLDVLEDTEALALFSRIVGEERAAAEPDATAEVLVACAGLPLAIRICAARLAKRRQWRVATLAARLRDQHRRLDELTTGDLAVRASFQVSYDSLRPVAGGVDPAGVFRLLSLWRGESIGGAAAAALVGMPADDVAEALEALVDVNLLESPAPDVYRFHDLLKVYAMERAQAEETVDAREGAVSRLLWWYLDTTQAAADAVSPRRYQVPRGGATVREPAPSDFAGLDEALAWYDAERGNLVAAARQAAEASLHEIAWRLPPTLFPAFNRRSNWADCVTANRVAVESARKAGDRPGEAWALNCLGYALAKLRDGEALGHLREALALREELGDVQGEVQTALALGVGYLFIDGPGAAALESMQRAVVLLRPMGASELLAGAVNNMGEVHYGLGDLDSAAECYKESCDIYREMGGYGLGHALHNLGRVYLALRRIDDANACFTEAVRVHRRSGDLLGEAIAIKNIGHARASIGDIAGARAEWSAALAIFEQINESVEAVDAIAALASLPAD